jgi:mRNA-degrading endonuclease RelE of RelBE toxin-antitoxin system
LVEVRWTPNFKKQYDKHPHHIRDRVDELIRFLQHDDNKRGNEIRKKLIPKKYRDLNNMFKYNLNGDRVLYTIVTTNKKAYLLLELLCHNSYNKLFGYRVN